MSQSMSCPLPNYKLVVVGDPEVGKSALCFQYFERKFITEYDPTIEDSYMHHINIDGKWCLVEVLDTAGKEEFSTWRKRNINEGIELLIFLILIS
jgi:Ras-related protein M-Ras